MKSDGSYWQFYRLYQKDPTSLAFYVVFLVGNIESHPVFVDLSAKRIAAFVVKSF